MNDSDRARKLIEHLSSMCDTPCVSCRRQLCSHEALINITTGFKDAPRCLDCLALELTDTRDRVRDRVFMFIFARPAFSAAWNWANRRENFDAQLPKCLWPKEQKIKTDHAYELPLPEENFNIPFDAELDGGIETLDVLATEMQRRLTVMKAGQVLKIAARDTSIIEDLPAWCRLTGHKLVSASHPVYFIKRREL